MTIWFTSDLHLGHKRIIELCNRPFKDVDEMNETIIRNWNSVVRERDFVYVLGDVALGTISESLPLCEQLNGMKYLVPGNHDRVWSGQKKIRELDTLRYEEAGFILCDEQLIRTFQGKKHMLCHFPYENDMTHIQDDVEDRYASFRPKRDSNIDLLLHGHVHNSWKINGDQINVGVDVWDFTPISIDKIQEVAY